MHPRSPRWITVSPSRHPWEQAALDHLQAALPDHEPYRVWANFELVAEDGSINEIDALVLSSMGLFLVEIKSRPGAVSGDGGTWSWRFEGRENRIDNPRLLANLKARRLKSRLEHTKAAHKQRLPFVEAVVFLSATNLETRGLDVGGRQGVFVRRGDADRSTPIPGLEPLYDWTPHPGTKLGAGTARLLERAMREIGIRPSQSLRQVGDYRLEELLDDGAGWQDWRAHHTGLPGVRRRLRLYHTRAVAGSETRETLARAARREMLVLQGIDHPGIVKALDYTEHELGPAVIFDDRPGARRFDHWLAERGPRLSFDQRLGCLRQLAEILAFAHGRRLVHRSLSPQSILVLDPDAVEPRLTVIGWHTGGRTPTTRGSNAAASSSALRATLHPDRLIEAAAGAYMAPELHTSADPDGIRADVFSLGALAYHLITGQPPAADAVALQETLLEHDGLDLSSAVDGVSVGLAWLVKDATRPNPGERFPDVGEILGLLDQVEDDLTTPDQPVFDPERAGKGERLPGGYKVLRRLGQGSTAIVFLVEKDGAERVLKLARTSEKNALLADEADVLERLRHQGIVELHGRLHVGERLGLLMARAGKETLAERLRTEQHLSLDFLERFGEDLLEIVQWLEEKGISHRDVKPENLGIQGVGKNETLHLVLFDFSLARAPADRCDLGTPPYLDPFLRRPGRRRWDLAAERFAVAMTLYEMATGRLPTWGGGDGDPLYAKDEVTLEPERFVPAVRARLAEFFARALRRDAAERFDNAEQMLRAWRRIFLESERPTLPTPHPPATADSATDTARPELLAGVTPETQIVELGLSSRGFHALEKLEVADVRALLRTPLGVVTRMRGVGAKTRHELIALVQALRPLFPEISTASAPESAPPTAPPEPVEGELHRALDRIAASLVPEPRQGPAGQREQALRLFLGLEGTAPRLNQSEVAHEVGVTRARISQYLLGARLRWAKLPALTAVRAEIAGLLELRGGVMSETEIATALLAEHGARATGEARERAAMAVARAASEVERGLAAPRWVARRGESAVVLARRADDAEEQTAQALAAWALRLGESADRLAARDPLPSPIEVLDALQQLTPPEGAAPIAAPRLVRLAAACSASAAVSSRAELYPRGLPAVRALTLAAGVAHGVKALSAFDLAERVRSRYPEAAPLPVRPALDGLLEQAGLDLRWDPDAGDDREGAYVPRRGWTLFSSTGTWSHVSRTPRPAPPPETLVAEDFEHRLTRAAAQGVWLVLLALPQQVVPVVERIAGRFPVAHLSLDQLLLEALREVAAATRVDWRLVLAADAAEPASRDRQNLARLLERALPLVEQRLLATAGTVLLTEPGLLGRYDRLDVLERLRERLARPEPGRALTGLWVLVPSDEQSERPRMFGRVVPVLGPGDWAWVPESWVQGAHLVRGAG